MRREPFTDPPRRTLRPAEHGTGHSADWPLIPVTLAYVALFAAITARWLLGLVTIPWDGKAHFLPQVQFLAQSLARGEAPWWNPFVFAGHPQIADPQSMLFSPPFVLLALVNGNPGAWAVDLAVIATMAAGGAGMIVLFRDQGWHWAGALVAALAFSFGAAMAWRMQHFGQVLSLAYWPWAAIALDRAIRRGSVLHGALAGLVAAFVVLGRDQVALLVLYLLAGQTVWAIASAPARLAALRRALLPLAAGAIVAAVIIALPIAMTVLLAAQSNRPQIDFIGAGRGSLHPALLLTLFSADLFGAASTRPDGFWGPPSYTWQGTDLYIAQNVGVLYIGALPVLAILLALVRGELWSREVRFFTIAVAVAFLYALGWYTPAFRVMYAVLPGVDLYRRPADAVFLVGALMAVLAGFAIHRMFERPWLGPNPREKVAATLVLLAALALALFFAWTYGRLADIAMPLGSAAASLALAALALGWARSRLAVQPVMAGLVLAGITAAELWYANGHNGSSALPAAHYEAMEPSTRNETMAWLKARVAEGQSAGRRDRVELAGLGFHWPNLSMTHRLHHTLGYNPVRLALTSRATGAEDHVGLPDQRKFSPLMPSYRSPLADLLGLRWIATGVPIEQIDRTLAPGALPLRHRTPEAWIYEHERALPRVLFAHRALAADFEHMLASGTWPDTDLARIVLLAPDRVDHTPRRPGLARLLAMTNTRVEVEAESPDGGWIVLNDAWHPWWEAESGGRTVPIERANVMFRAVKVPPGRHRVTFTFRPVNGTVKELAERLKRR